MIVGVQGQIGLNALETRDNAGERAHVPAKTRNRGRRRNAAVPAARHDQPVTRAKLDRRWLAAGITQLLAAAARTLRTERHIMLHDGRAQQVEADDVIAQWSAKTGGDRLGDLDGRKLEGGQAGGALDDANAELAQGGPELRSSLHIDRLNAHTTFLEISLRSLRR